MVKYVDLFIGDIRFNDWADLFFAALFYWLAWNIADIYGVVFLTAVFLMRLKENGRGKK